MDTLFLAPRAHCIVRGASCSMLESVAIIDELLLARSSSAGRGNCGDIRKTSARVGAA